MGNIYKFLLVIFLILSHLSFSQIYKGVKELEMYENELKEIDEYLKSDPVFFKLKYEKLSEIAKQKKDNSLLSILYIYKGTAEFYLNNNDSARYYFEKAGELAESIKSYQILTTAKIRRIYCDENILSASELSVKMQEQLFNSILRKDTINMIHSLNGLALFQTRMDDKEKSIQYYYKALELAESSENYFEVGFILNNLGLVKLELNALDSAYTDLTKGVEIAQQINALRLECHLHENLGYYYLKIDSTDLALDKFYLMLEISKSKGYKDIQLSSLANISTVERVQKNYQKADSLINESLKLTREYKFNHAYSTLYQSLAMLNKENRNYTIALLYLDSSLIHAEFTSSIDVKINFHKLKAEIYEEAKNFKESLFHYQSYQQIKDSLNNIGNSEKLQEIQFKYRDEKKEKQRLKEKNELELQIKEKEINLQKNSRNALIVFSIFVLIISIILILFYRLKQKKEKEYSYTISNKLEEERGRIARDLHDGIGQSLIILKNKFSNKNLNETEIASINDNFTEVIEEIRSVSRTLIPPELKRLGLKKAIQKMANDIENSFDIIVITDIEVFDKIKLEEHQSIRIYRIIQELCTNTLKHSQAKSLKIESYMNNKDLIIIYQDNGKGLDIEKWTAYNNSVGLKSIEQRLKFLNGEIKFEKPKVGFKVKIKINLK